MRKTVEKVKSESAPKMKEDAMNNGQTKPGYNIRIATENQFITNYDIFWRPNDQGTLIPFPTLFSDRYGIQRKALFGEIDVNHQANEYKAEAKRLLTSERGLYHRSNRPIEPEAVFGDIKQNHGFKRFKLKSNVKVKVEFGLVALTHNLRKYIALERNRSNAACSCL